MKSENKPPITQEYLEAYLAIEQGLDQIRRQIFRAVEEGRVVEPGPLDVNALALNEPGHPLVINQRAAALLREAARLAVDVQPINADALEVEANPGELLKPPQTEGESGK